MCGTSRRLSFRPAFIYPGSRRLLWMSGPVRGRGQPGIFSQKNASAVTSRGARFLLGEDAKSRVAVPRGRRRAAEGGERKRDLGRPRRRLWRGHVLLLPTGVRARWDPARGRRRGPTRPRPAALSPPLSGRRAVLVRHPGDGQRQIASSSPSQIVFGFLGDNSGFVCTDTLSRLFDWPER